MLWYQRAEVPHINSDGLEQPLEAGNQTVEGDRFVQIVELPVLHARNVRAGRQSVEPTGKHIARRDANCARIALPASAQLRLKDGHHAEINERIPKRRVWQKLRRLPE